MIEWFRKTKKSVIVLYAIGGILCAGLFGSVVVTLLDFQKAADKKAFRFSASVLLDYRTWAIGLVGCILLGLFMALKKTELFSNTPSKGVLAQKGDQIVEGALENSRFMTEKERDNCFVTTTYENIDKIKKDGVPIMALVDGRGKMKINLMPGCHSLVIGATGSGKTTTFVNPMIQLLGASSCGSSMVITDPKGELFDLHSKFLKSRGYDVLILNLRDTYESSRWNPLGSIWDQYRNYINAGQGIKAHRDSVGQYTSLKRMDDTFNPGEVWIEWNGRAYSDAEHCQDDIFVTKQKIYDELYEDLNDLVCGICPITNEKDPLWEKGARSIVMATCLAMLEDSEYPELGMTKEKFNFFNINKILTNNKDNYKELKQYFEGRDPLSMAVSLSKQVLSAADQTMASYMSITFDKLSLFNDKGICGLTSDTDIHAEQFAEKPTALFLRIPDEKDTRHGLASLFILSIYKALIKVASAREDLSLPRNVYFIMDEFGNMPKIEKFGQMITVGRSRKIWFHMVVQSYSQLKNVYGETVSDIVKSNCAMKMFIGSNDIGTCKEFSELCGNVTVRTTSTSASTGTKAGEMSISSQIQTRPLIYPSELQKLNNKHSTGNAIIVTFGNYPLRTQYTPSYKCSYYHMGKMDTDDIRSHSFHPDKVFYDINKRNSFIFGE